MIYHMMYIHGIYVVYRGISMDVHSFLKTDFAVGPCCWSHSMRTRVCCFSIAFMEILPGEEAAHERLNPTPSNLSPLSLAAGVMAAAAAVSRASFRFPSLVAGNDLNLDERWGQGCLQGR